MPAKDLHLSLRTAYVTAMESSAALLALLGDNKGGQDNAIYDSVPADTLEPYIYFGGFTSNDAPTAKTIRGYDVTITLIVVTKFTGEGGGNKDSDDIVNEIMQVIMPAQRNEPLDLSADNFKMIQSSLDNSITFLKKNQGGKQFSRSLRFRHTIFQI